MEQQLELLKRALLLNSNRRSLIIGSLRGYRKKKKKGKRGRALMNRMKFEASCESFTPNFFLFLRLHIFCVDLPSRVIPFLKDQRPLLREFICRAVPFLLSQVYRKEETSLSHSLDTPFFFILPKVFCHRSA